MLTFLNRKVGFSAAALNHGEKPDFLKTTEYLSEYLLTIVWKEYSFKKGKKGCPKIFSEYKNFDVDEIQVEFTLLLDDNYSPKTVVFGQVKITK